MEAFCCCCVGDGVGVGVVNSSESLLALRQKAARSCAEMLVRSQLPASLRCVSRRRILCCSSRCCRFVSASSFQDFGREGEVVGVPSAVEEEVGDNKTAGKSAADSFSFNLLVSIAMSAGSSAAGAAATASDADKDAAKTVKAGVFRF